MGWFLPENLGGVSWSVQLASQNVYPILRQKSAIYPIPCMSPDQIFDTLHVFQTLETKALLQTCHIISSLVQTDYEGLLFMVVSII